MSDAPRKMTFLTAEPEKRLLRWLAEHMPRRVTSDNLTVLGVLGAIGGGVSYALTVKSPLWLWGASGAIALNWFGDSLDGTVARVRKAERPKYGYYLDHAVDGFNTAVVGIGIGLSPFVPLETAFLLVTIYLLLSINVYLETEVYGSFKMGYGVFGPTEVRIILILLNTGLFAAGVMGVSPASVRTYAGWVVGGAAVAMFGILVVRFVRNLAALGRMEPRK